MTDTEQVLQWIDDALQHLCDFELVKLNSAEWCYQANVLQNCTMSLPQDVDAIGYLNTLLQRQINVIVLLPPDGHLTDEEMAILQA